ncbi:MAG TPA: hypothetical protein VGQ99_05160, partial [Tepidisphaeraceae bacterium]|nr:hypothetical protein [Tepidisphaeraceae bacterium]
MKKLLSTFLSLLALSSPSFAAEVPKSPYIAIVYGYADAMLKHGRDTYGTGQTGFLLSALDRKTLSAIPNYPIANARLDQNLVRILYTLSELSGKPIYRDAAEREIRAFLVAGGDTWNVLTDETVRETIEARDTLRPWMLWEKSLELEPDLSKKFVLRTGTGPNARYTAFGIRAFACAYQSMRETRFQRMAESYLDSFDHVQSTSTPAEMLSIAIDCDGAASRLPQPLASRLRDYAAAKDDAFLALPHDLKGQSGFAFAKNEFTPLWNVPNHRATTAMLAMLCVSRYENTANIKFRDLIHAAADAYRVNPPTNDIELWPMTFGHAISLELAAWRSTAKQEYLDSARTLADLALKTFWTNNNPLPRATTRTDNYDTLTGSDTLALSLLELHLSILHITAVRCPPN